MHKWIFIISLLFPISLFSQQVLPLPEAIKIALEENYGIQIAILEQTAANMEIYKANAGMGPTVDLNGNYRTTGNYANQRFLDGRVVDRFGRAFNPSINISANWTLFDGGQMQATYDRLGLMGQYSELQGKVLIQNTIANVMQAYYNIIRHKETVEYLNTILKYYEERLKITEERWQVGQGSKLNFLQSKTDMNAQLSQMASAKNNLRNAKVILNGLLNRTPSQDFEVANSENVPSNYEFNQLAEQVKTKNQEILLLQKSMDISLKQEEEIAATRKPQVFVNGSAGYSYNNSNTGFLTSSQNTSIVVGIGARWNLYDGNHRQNQMAISQINTRIIEQQQENLAAQILNDLTFAYNQYNSDRELLEFEEQNKTIAEENLSISLEKFRLGGSSILELNEAQRAYDTALNRLVNAQYNIKISELDLLRLSGTLLD